MKKRTIFKGTFLVLMVFVILSMFTHTVIVANAATVGDLNGDGATNIADGVILQKYLIGKSNISEEYAKKADLNGDNQLDIFDLILLKKVIIYGNVQGETTTATTTTSTTTTKKPTTTSTTTSTTTTKKTTTTSTTTSTTTTKKPTTTSTITSTTTTKKPTTTSTTTSTTTTKKPTTTSTTTSTTTTKKTTTTSTTASTTSITTVNTDRAVIEKINEALSEINVVDTKCPVESVDGYNMDSTTFIFFDSDYNVWAYKALSKAPIEYPIIVDKNQSMVKGIIMWRYEGSNVPVDIYEDKVSKTSLVPYENLNDSDVRILSECLVEMEQGNPYAESRYLKKYDYDCNGKLELDDLKTILLYLTSDPPRLQRLKVVPTKFYQWTEKIYEECYLVEFNDSGFKATVVK